MKQLLPKFSPGNKEKQAIQKMDGEHRQMGLPAIRNIKCYSLIQTVFLFALLAFGSSAIGQTITGTTTVCVGATTTLSYSSNGGTWSSSNTSIATVDPVSGVVGGVAPGTATISYTVAGNPVSVDVTVGSLPDPGTISGSSAVCILIPANLTSSVSGGVWSANNAIATVSSTGVVTGAAIGSDIISYTVTNGCGSKSATTNILVNGVVGDIYVYGGIGNPGAYSGDGGPAFMAHISQPRDLTTDNDGNVYFCDVLNNRVREISKSGVITTIAGNGIAGNTGDGGPATAAELDGPNGVFVDNSGNIFISNTSYNTIRKVNPAGIITAVAGVADTIVGSSGDGGPATAARFNLPLGILEDASGNIYVADQGNNKVRKINMSNGIITTVAGNGTAGYTGDGGAATAAEFHTVRGLTQDNAGNIYIADALNNVIRKYVPSTGIITTFAGTGTSGHTGDGGPATAATLTSPARFAYDGANILYITDQSNNVIREVNLATGIITQVAGNATAGFTGDGMNALTAQLHTPAGIAGDHFGHFFIADAGNNVIRMVPSTGSIAASLIGPSTVCAGTPVTLTAFLSSSGSPVYQWQKNGTNVESSGPTFTDASPANGDIYRCIVTVTPGCSDPFNDTSNNITITVNSPAAGITGSTTVYPGQTTTLSDATPGGTWTSSAAAVATIDASGVLYGVSAGNAVITYHVTNICGTTTANVTVTINATDTITASAGINGMITPSGQIPVNGGDEVFTIIPNAGYHITDVSVDGVSKGAISSYTFASVSAPHIINASFAPDCDAPVITVCPGNITSNNDAGACGANVTYSAATVTGSSPTITYSQNSGTSFPVGTTIVTVNATNTCGTTTCSFNVTVNDTQNPTITAPADVTLNGYCAPVAVTLGSPTTADNCGVANTINDAPSLFSVGTTTVHWTVTDVNGNSATTTQMVTVNSGTVSISPSITNVSCNGSSNGGIATTISGGTGSYSYSWGNGATTSAITGVANGTYSVTVTDDHSCTATGSYTITQPSAALNVAGAVTNAGCNGASTGAISTTVTGGTSGYSYLWNTGATTSGLSAVSSGSYSVTVTDANSCTATGSFTVSQPSAALNLTATVTNVACNGGATGGITTSVSGGTLPYTYGWNIDATTPGISGKAAGSYSVTITDANSCTTSGSYTISQPSAALSVSGTVTNVSCNGASTGAVTTSVSGGTGSYSYAWSNGATTPGLSGKTSGTYSLTVTDANSCTATGSYSITQPSAALNVSGTVTNVSCNGGSTGAVTTSVSGGAGSYSYLWNTGATTPGLSGKTSGTYSVTVTDANSCTATGSYSITQPSAALGVSGTVTNVKCNGGSTGSVATSVSGGTGSYSYAWSTGVTTSGISGMATGTYSVTVTDANSCTAAGSYSITQPSAALSVSGTITNVKCNGASTGSVATSVSGGTGSYSYAWSTGVTTSGISGKATGTYSVTVTDANSCTATGSYSITQPSAALSVTGTVTNVNCNGGSTGSVTTSVSGGTGSYSYSWNSGATTSGLSAKAAGAYNVTVTDANSCTATGSYSITQPSAALSVSGTVTSVGCSGGSTGSVATAVSGGTSSYTYAWSTGATTSGISSKPTGTYSVTVTDAHSCTATGTYTITQAPGPTSSITGNSSVLGGTTNTFTAAAGMSTYSWSVTGGSASISGSASGSSVNISSPCSAATYTVNLTATQSGCSSTSHKVVSVTASAKINVYCALYTTSSGHYPTVSKACLPADIKVYDRHICGAQDGNQSHYSSVWNGTTGLITNCVVSDPVTVNIGGGPAYQYTCTVPAGGHYLCIGKSNVSSSYYSGSNCTLFTAQKCGGYDPVDGYDHDNDADLVPCSDPVTKYHCGLRDASGRCSEGYTQEEHGSLLLIVSPTTLNFDDSIANLPVIYESVEGSWDASVSAAPPDGFYAIPSDSLSTSVTDSVMNAVQFYIADTGSVWTNTTLTHNLFHKGASRTAYSHPIMVNNRTNKLTDISIVPNPGHNTINVVLPKFEGRATVRIYNMLGQKLAEKKINVDGGLSTSMDVSSFPPGVYLVAVENSYSRVTSRLIKQ